MAIYDKNIRLMRIASFLKSKPKGASFKEILKHLEELYHKESFAKEKSLSLQGKIYSDSTGYY